MILESVPLSDIDLSDCTFAFREPGVPEEISRSVEKWGVLTPLLLRGKPGAWTIVSGHRRARACSKNGGEHLPAWTASSDELPLSTALHRLAEENRFGLPLTALETGRLLAKLRDLTGAGEDAMESYGRLLGLSGGKGKLNRVLSLPSLPTSILEDPRIKDGVLFQLVLLPDPAPLLLFENWIASRGPSVQEVREAVEWILDLSARDGLNPADIIRSALEGDIPFHPRLRSMRFPAMVALEEEILRVFRDLPRGVRASLHPRREDDRLRFSFDARTGGEITALAWAVARLEPALEAVFEAACETRHRDEF